jgi:para-aminobenzoate synthetase component 1
MRAPVSELPPFQGGAAGYLAYDWARQLERLPAPRFDDLAMADVLFGIYDWVIAWDHEMSRAWLISTGMPETDANARDRRAAERAAAVQERLRSNGFRAASPEQRAATHSRMAPSYPVDGSDPRLGLRSSYTHAAYLDAVNRVVEYIRAGDIFQANLSQRFEAPLVEPPWDLYLRLRTQNAAPFAAYLDFPDALILSASPERFLRVAPDGHVETRPIKGTRPRGVGPEHDAALGQALTESAKDRAENLMIVDLIRNDLSRVCAPGTVRVRELFALEHFATVHHLVSTVVGRLGDDAIALDLLRAAFPGGSITGAPKIRAMEIIAELEPSARGVYCGAIGYLSLTGALDTSIPIRTAVVRGGRVYLSAGGGIVADSDAEQEYRETLDKARGMIDALIASA